MDLLVVNPQPFLAKLLGKQVSVKLKWNGLEYRGFLASVDDYMNVHLASCEEFQRGKHKGQLGEVVIRCNNVLYIAEVDSEANDSKMSDQ